MFPDKSIPLFAYCSALHFLSLNEIRSVKLHTDTIRNHVHLYATLCTVCGGNLSSPARSLSRTNYDRIHGRKKADHLPAQYLCPSALLPGNQTVFHPPKQSHRSEWICINYRCVMRRADLQNLFHGTAASGTIQIEICMICHVKIVVLSAVA